MITAYLFLVAFYVLAFSTEENHKPTCAQRTPEFFRE